MAQFRQRFRNGKSKGKQSDSVAVAAWPVMLTMALVLASSIRADAPKVLSGHEIAERNKPGVVLIKSEWQTKFEVWDPTFTNADQLYATIRQQIRAGLVKPSEENRALLQEIANHPKDYLTRSKDSEIVRWPLKARGSGFIITPDGYIVTNEHVVSIDRKELIGITADWLVSQRADALTKRLASKFQLEADDTIRKQLESAFEQYYLRGGKDGGVEVLSYDEKPTKITARIPIFNGTEMTVKEYECDVRKEGKANVMEDGEPTPGKDVAILKVEANNLPTVPVGDDNALSQGDQIYLMGFPAAAEVGGSHEEPGVEATLTAGRFSARRTMSGGWKAIQTDASMNHGNSGGPGFNDRGEVIGISTFGATGEDTKGLYYLVPMSVVNQFIQELNIKPRDGELSVQYRNALASFEAGDYGKARTQLLAIKEESAGFPFVQEYIDRLPNAGGFQYWQTLIWVAVAAVLLAVGGFVMTRRKPKLAPAALATAAVAGVPAGKTQLSSSLPSPAGQTYGSLQCSAGPLSGHRFIIPKQGLLIGRDSSKCQIVLAEDDVSKEHAWVVPLDGSVVVIDRGSTNGVFVNSMDSPRVSKVPLKNGDRILIGRSAATFTYHSV